jgi:hypothetical protein
MDQFLGLIIATVVLLYFTRKPKSTNAKVFAGVLQLVFAIIVYIFSKDLLGTSIHAVAPEKTGQFLFMYFLSLAGIIVYGLLGLGNLFIGISELQKKPKRI